MTTKVLEFIIDYFTNFTPRKAFGGVLVLIGFYFVMKTRMASSPDKAVLFGIAGIFIGGIGLISILYEDGRVRKHADLEVVGKAYDKIERDKKTESWHMPEATPEKKIPKDQN